MKKTAIFLAIVLVVSVFALSSCELLAKIPVIGDLINKPCESHTDTDNDYVCDNCGEKLQHDDPQPEPDCEHKDENSDHKCDSCDETLGECADADSDHNCDVCGEALSECADADTNHKCDVCGADMGEHKEAEGSHSCGYCGAVISECADANGDLACDVCGAEMLPENMERVEYALNISDLETGTLAADAINGKFTIVSGSEIRNRTKTFEGVEYTKSVKIGNAATKIKVNVPGAGKLSFLIQNGSSGAAMQFVTVTAPDGTVQDIEFLGTDGGSPIVKIEIDVTEGEWIISRGKNGGTQDIFALDLSCIVQKSEENGFELVSAGTVDYLCGQELDLSGLRLNATYANGKTEPLAIEDVTVDTSLVNLGQSGVYTVTVSYKNYEPITYNVNVYLPVSVTLGLDAIEKIANSSAGNGVYFNHSFKEVYAVGEELDITGLSVIVNGSLDGVTKSFNVGNQYAVVNNDLQPGANTVTVKYAFGADEVIATVNVYVVDTAPSIVDDVYQVKVDANYDGVIGAVEGGYNMFATIQQALDFLADSDVAKQKVMLIAPGYYWEKLEIEIPYLHIVGAGADKVTIEWDSLYGLVDAGGFTHTTDSTQTVAIRESATNVTIEGVTISNFWNSQQRMDEAGLAIERGLALLVQADRFIMKDSALLGIQDTLELFTGRQYFENVFISGYTDFIFGTNNTTLFKNCTIHVIDTVKDDQGTAGYLTAFKGSNKGATDAIVYGAIFDGCKFTADEGVMAGKTAIGRTWGAYAAVAIINSELGEHISIDGYDSANNKNKRYISMNGIHPTDETVQFVEFNNTGAGAITEAVAGMRFLTADEAALYVSYATIFGTNNGKVSYLDPWNPEITEIVVDDRDYYYFNGSSSASGSSHTFDTTTTIAKGETLEWDGLLISAEAGNVAWNSNANSLNMKAGAFIKFTVKAGTTVTVETYPNYNYFTLNGVGTASANMLSQYYAEDTEVTLLSTGDLYLYSIIINPDEEAPAAPTLSEIKVSGFNTNYVVGDELSLEGAVVKAYYSDNSVVEVVYTVDYSAVVNSAAGEYEVVFSFEGKTATVTVTYEDPNAGPEIAKPTILDFSTPDGLAAAQNNPKVTIDGSVRHNGAEIQISGTISFIVKAGTLIKVDAYANTSYASYTIGEEGAVGLETLNVDSTFFATKDCTVVYTGLSNNYLVALEIVPPVSNETYVFGSSNTTEGDYTNVEGSVGNIIISGQVGNNGDSIQLKQNTVISFAVPGFSSVIITGHSASYGQLVVTLNGSEVVEADANGVYTFSTTAPTQVTIACKNVGTEEEPAYNKSYLKAIKVVTQDAISESLTVSFGSAGNYKDCGIDFSGIQIGDNGGNNSQIKNGSFSFVVKAGAIVTINSYSGYTSYTFSDGFFTSEEITADKYEYTASEDVLITITPVNGNNYFYSFSIVYPVVFEENTTIDLSATGANIQGATGNYEGLEIDATNGKFADNNGGWVQVNAGTVIKLNVLDGAEVSVTAYSSADNFAVAIVDGVCTITCNANDYLSAITVKYAVVYDKATTINLSATGANIQKTVGTYEGLTVDATNGKFADNNGGWVQVNAGTIITLNVADGAVVSVTAYSSADNFAVVVADGVCTITCNANDYLSAIAVSY